MNKERVLAVFRAGFYAGANGLRTRTLYRGDVAAADKVHWFAGFDAARDALRMAEQRYTCQLLARHPFAFAREDE